MRFHERVMGVYFDDLDMYKILHNARYILLFERTLGSLWEELAGAEMMVLDHPNLRHLVRASTVEYLRPVRGTGKVRVRVWVENLGRTSLTFGFRLMPMFEDVDCARGTRTVVHIDEDGGPAVWSDDFRAVLAPWLGKET